MEEFIKINREMHMLGIVLGVCIQFVLGLVLAVPDIGSLSAFARSF